MARRLAGLSTRFFRTLAWRTLRKDRLRLLQNPTNNQSLFMRDAIMSLPTGAGKELVPRKLHYCWFGGKEKTDLVRFCAETWRRYCPDFEIKEWNESNFDVDGHPIAAAAYRHKK